MSRGPESAEPCGQQDVRWTISIVSHGHGARVTRGMLDIHRQLADVAHRFVLTLNAGEDAAFIDALPNALRSATRVIANPSPKGYGANHNAALRDARSDFVLVADPDLSVSMPVFGALEQALADPACGIVSPQAETPDGKPEDNGRALVTPAGLLRRYLLAQRWRRPSPPADGRGVDWVAGLFMAMRSDTFLRLGGFDEGFHLYCEDVDLCLRARVQGLQVRLLHDLRIGHAANRSTLKRPEHLLWHLQSLLRLWRSDSYRAIRHRAAGGDSAPPAP